MIFQLHYIYPHYGNQRQFVDQTEIEGMDEDDHSSFSFMNKLEDWVQEIKKNNKLPMYAEWDLISERSDNFLSWARELL